MSRNGYGCMVYIAVDLIIALYFTIINNNIISSNLSKMKNLIEAQ